MALSIIFWDKLFQDTAPRYEKQFLRTFVRGVDMWLVTPRSWWLILLFKLNNCVKVPMKRKLSYIAQHFNKLENHVHLYEPVNGEILICRKDHREEAKQYDKHVIGTYRISSKNDSMQLVGHVPMELWCIVCCFLSHCIGAFNWERALIRANTAWS